METIYTGSGRPEKVKRSVCDQCTDDRERRCDNCIVGLLYDEADRRLARIYAVEKRHTNDGLLRYYRKMDRVNHRKRRR